MAAPTVAVKTLRAVGYLRRSTDHQDRSLGDQQKAIETYAHDQGLSLLRFYTDDAISGTNTAGRQAFKQMIQDAHLRPRPFDVIAVYDVSRFGRMDNDESGYYRHLLRLNGVAVHYTSEQFRGDFTDDLIRPVKQWQARQASMDLAKLVIRGYISKFKLSKGGWWLFGVPPFGFDRRYEDAEGNFLFVLRRMPDRSRQMLDEGGKIMRVLAPGERLMFVSDRDHCRLVPGAPERVNLVRRIFYEYTEMGLGTIAIAREFNQEGVPTPREL